jgi:molybdopterin/thiamine biosynthesis adenylyltransferase
MSDSLCANCGHNITSHEHGKDACFSYNHNVLSFNLSSCGCQGFVVLVKV